MAQYHPHHQPCRLSRADCETQKPNRQRHLGLWEPRGDLSSTGYALAKPGMEYLVLQPREKGDPFTVTLEAGTYMAQWYNVNSRETKEDGKMTVTSDGSASFTAPFAEAGPAVLYLRQVGR